MSGYKALQNGSDIRGISIEGVPGENVNLGPIEAINIGFAFAKFLKDRGYDGCVAIGRDPRLSGKELGKHLASGLIFGGVKVTDYDIASTPAMFMSTVFPETKCIGAVMITASHLPYNRNGFKFFTPGGGLNKEDITEILATAEEAKISTTPEINSESKSSDELMKLYCAHLRNLIIAGCSEQFDSSADNSIIQDNENISEKPLSGLTVAVDAGNGSGGFYANNVLKPLGANVYGKFLEPDGSFPNHAPNPENKEAMSSISQAVKESNADLGLIFDTDCDRSGAVDETGKEIARNGIVALAAALINQNHPGTTVVTDSITSPQLTKFLEEKLGMKHLRFKRGYRNVINKAIELNEKGIESHLAIETSGHAAIKDNYFLDDGAFLATLIVIKTATLKKQGESISSVLSELEEPAESIEIRMNITGDDFAEKGDEILTTLGMWIRNHPHMKAVSPNYEGVRADYKNGETSGWFLLRKSLHDPIMPLNIESDNIGGTKEIAFTLKEFLDGFKELDTSNL